MARQTNGHVVAEPERRVVPAVERHGPDRKLRPLGELLGEQAPDERDVQMFGMRLASAHGHLLDLGKDRDRRAPVPRRYCARGERGAGLPGVPIEAPPRRSMRNPSRTNTRGPGPLPTRAVSEALHHSPVSEALHHLREHVSRYVGEDRRLEPTPPVEVPGDQTEEGVPGHDVGHHRTGQPA